MHKLDWAEADWQIIKEYQSSLIGLTQELDPAKRKLGFQSEKKSG